MAKVFPDSKLETNSIKTLSISSLIDYPIDDNGHKNDQNTSDVGIDKIKEDDQCSSQNVAKRQLSRESITLDLQENESTSKTIPRLMIVTVPQHPTNRGNSQDNIELDFEVEKRMNQEKAIERNEIFIQDIFLIGCSYRQLHIQSFNTTI